MLIPHLLVQPPLPPPLTFPEDLLGPEVALFFEDEEEDDVFLEEDDEPVLFFDVKEPSSCLYLF